MFVVVWIYFFYYYYFFTFSTKIEDRLGFHCIPTGLDYAVHGAEQGHSCRGSEDTHVTQPLSLRLLLALSFICSHGSRS